MRGATNEAMNEAKEGNRTGKACTVRIYRGWSILDGAWKPVYSWYFDFGMMDTECIEVEIPRGMRLIPSPNGAPKLNPGDGILRDFHSMLAQGVESPAIEWQDADMRRHRMELKTIAKVSATCAGCAESARS